MKLFVIYSVAFVALVYASDNYDDGPVHYNYEYAVHDPKTGDKKSHYESRDGHVVKGSYSVHDPDGTQRIVDYIADHKNGFQAVVKRIGEAHHAGVYGASDDKDGGESHVGVTKWGKD